MWAPVFIAKDSAGGGRRGGMLGPERIMFALAGIRGGGMGLRTLLLEVEGPGAFVGTGPVHISEAERKGAGSGFLDLPAGAAGLAIDGGGIRD